MKKRCANKQYFIFVCIAAFSFLTTILIAQKNDSSEYIISHHLLSVEDGLASREVFCGLQDNDGFLWFGTRNGLNRYDGKDFQLFTKQKNGLKENNIIQLAKDNNNHLFIVYGQRNYLKNFKDMEVMDLNTHKIKTLKEFFPELPFKQENVYWVTNDGDDVCFLVAKPYQYWRLTSKGFELKCEMKKWDERIQKPNLVTEFQPSWYYLFRGKYCALSIMNSDYSYLITPDSTVVIEKSDYKIAGITPQNEILWYKYNENIFADFYKIDEDGKYNKVPMTVSSQILFKKMYIVQSANFYDICFYSMKDGLFLYNHQHLIKLLDAAELKGYESVNSFFNDNLGNKWFCTPTGVVEAKIETNRFTQYFTKSQTGTIGDNQARGIYADLTGTVYANVWDKLYISNGTQKRFNICYAIAHHNNKFYISERNLIEYDEQKNNFSSPLFKPGHEVAGELCAIDSLSERELLLGYGKSFEKYDVISKKVTVPTYQSPDFPKPKFVYRFIKRKNKKIWMIAENGMFLIDEKGENVFDYWGNETNKKAHKFPFDMLLDAFESNDGIFWLATNGEGLYRWNIEKNEFKQFNITAGFPSDILYRIEEDENHNLWISTDNGLVRFNTKDYKVSTYTTKQGVSHNEFNKISSFKSNDGRLYFGGLDGVNAFYPKDFVNDTNITNAPLRIISYSQFSGEQDELIDQTSQLLEQKKIVLQPTDRFFNIEFKLLDYEEGKSSYTYKIDGIDKEWNFINQNSIRISGLPYGKYVLRIRGQSQIGRKSKNEITIPIEVITPLFKKVWFQLFLLFIFTILVLFIIRYRTESLKRSKKLLAATVDKRTHQLRQTLGEKDVLLKEIHHRVKNNLQVIVSLLNMHQKNIDSPQLQQSFAEAKTNVRSISLIHENLYQHDSLAGVDMQSFADDLFNLINNLFNSSKEKVNFDKHISNIELDIETAVPIGLVLNELLTNSFKYTLGKHKEMNIELSIIKGNEQDSYRMTYSDNGIGLPKDFDFKTTTTMGMTLVKDLCRQIGGTINYHFDNGSCFEINFLSMKGRKSTD